MGRFFKRDRNGRFARTSGGAKKKRKTTTSRKNGVTYETKHQRGLFGGVTVSTKAYKGAKYVGSLEGFHNTRKKQAHIDFLYVTPEFRGKGVSKGLANRQVFQAKKHGLQVNVTGERSVGGQKFVERNALVGAKIAKRDKSMTSAEITSLMNGVGAGQARSHAKAYKKQQARKKKAAARGIQSF